MNIMTKRGQLDNIVTYEHFCDDVADLANIPQEQITLGSIAVALKDGSTEGLIVYIADSNKQWIPLIVGGGGNTPAPISDIAHICTQDEYDNTTGIPTVVLPLENTFYFVPSTDGEANNLFKEWIYVNGNWELFGSVDAPTGALQSDWEQTNSTSLDFIKNKPFGEQKTYLASIEFSDFTTDSNKLNTTNGVTTIPVTANEFVDFFPASYWNLDKIMVNVTINGTVYNNIPLTRHEYSIDDGDDTYSEFAFVYNANDNLPVNRYSNWELDHTTNNYPFAIYIPTPSVSYIYNYGMIFIPGMNSSEINTCTIQSYIITITQIEDKYLIQSDWNENDSTSAAYIKNRPCYKEETQQILCEDKIINTTGMSTNNYYSTTSPVSLMGVTMSIVDVFEVKYNGINYYPSPVVLDSNTIIVGANPGTDNSYPFGILWQKISNDYYAAIRIFANQYGENTFSIKTRNVIIQHLDKSYLPTQIFDPMTGDLTIEGTSLTLGNTTITETQLQNLLSLSDATGVGF